MPRMRPYSRDTYPKVSHRRLMVMLFRAVMEYSAVADWFENHPAGHIEDGWSEDDAEAWALFDETEARLRLIARSIMHRRRRGYRDGKRIVPKKWWRELKSR